MLPSVLRSIPHGFSSQCRNAVRRAKAAHCCEVNNSSATGGGVEGCGRTGRHSFPLCAPKMETMRGMLRPAEPRPPCM